MVSADCFSPRRVCSRPLRRLLVLPEDPADACRSITCLCLYLQLAFSVCNCVQTSSFCEDSTGNGLGFIRTPHHNGLMDDLNLTIC